MAGRRTTTGWRAHVAAVALLAPVLLVPPPAAAGPAGAAGDTRPNIVLVVTDDQTLENQRALTFVNRQIAGRGTTFTNARVSFPVCCPSRATILTGQYAHNHGVLGNHAPRGGYTAFDDTSTLATWLDDAGYFTAFVGKYLNEYGARHQVMPIPPGWDDWFAKVGAGDVYYRHEVLDGDVVVSYGREPDDYSTDVYAAQAAEVIRGRAGDDAPFFVQVMPLAPHGADFGLAVAAPRHEGAFADEPLPRPPSFDEADVRDKPERVRAQPRLSAGAVAEAEARYRARMASLLAVDDLVRQIVESLKAIGEYDETIIVFTSDNGWFEGQHRLANGKGLPYEPALRVPLVVAGPGFPRRARVHAPVSNVDIAPTLAAAAGAEVGLVTDGIPLQEVAADPAAHADRSLLVEAWGEVPYAAVRTARWQYVEYENGERELYDLARDPHQLQSQHARPSTAGVRAALAAQLEVLRACSGETCRQRDPTVPDG